jgi:hypothetical protein
MRPFAHLHFELVRIPERVNTGPFPGDLLLLQSPEYRRGASAKYENAG